MTPPENHAAERKARSNSLVLACLRKGRDLEKISELKKLAADDWEDIVAVAARLRVVPLIFYTISPFISELTVPGELFRKMRNIYYGSAGRNMRLHRQLLDIISRFNREGISVLTLKGAHLAEFVYDNPALRPMSDLDILARRDDLDRIDLILKDLGYSQSQPSAEIAGCVPRQHLAPYTKKNAAPIEVHFRLTCLSFSGRFDPAGFWQRAREQKNEDVKILALGPEDLLLHLCAHAGMQHVFDNGLLPYVDILRVVEHYEKELDWEALFERSREWGVERCVFLMLALTEDMLGLALPGAVRREMGADAQTKAALAAALRLIFEKGPFVSSSFAQLFGQGWRSKLKAIHVTAFPSKDIMSAETPTTGHITSFYQLRFYWLRSKWLWKKYAKTIWAALRKNPQTIAAIKIQTQRNNLSDWLGKTN